MQLASMDSPRSVRISETCRYASGYRRYQRTASRITSPGYWRPLNGFVGVIGMEFLPYQSGARTSQRNRCNVVSTKDIAYRLIGNNVAQISQCSDDAVITSAGVLFGQCDNQFGNLSADPRPTWTIGISIRR